jgi:hypothetical protein
MNLPAPLTPVIGDSVGPGPEDVGPFEIDMVPVVAVGTAVWTVLLVIFLALHGTLVSHHRGWWVSVAATGVGLGVLGLAVSLRFRNKQRETAQTRTPPVTPS